jgi:hemerythrin superfamily protein
MDALKVLIADHNRVRGLFKLYEQAHGDGNTEAAGRLVGRIIRELEVHTRLEEEVFYPRVHDLDEEVADTVEEGLEEHHVANTLMEEISQLEPGDDQWVAKVKVLMESVQHHIGEEEEELFPDVRSELDAAALEELGQRLDAMKRQLGAPAMADKIGLSLEELRTLAREQEIPGRSGMDKEELAATVAPPA